MKKKPFVNRKYTVARLTFPVKHSGDIKREHKASRGRHINRQQCVASGCEACERHSISHISLTRLQS